MVEITVKIEDRGKKDTQRGRYFVSARSPLKPEAYNAGFASGDDLELVVARAVKKFITKEM